MRLEPHAFTEEWLGVGYGLLTLPGPLREGGEVNLFSCEPVGRGGGGRGEGY